MVPAMTNVVTELEQLVAEFSSKINSVPDAEFSAKPLPGKWSQKEVLGHLIDSAHNNLRRFVCGQYEKVPPKIIYEQDFWVTANAYQRAQKEDVILLWKLVNARICDILKNMPQQNRERQCDTGRDRVQLHSLRWLAEDYLKHMKHHLNQIFPKSFDDVNPRI
jgi:hypothetical protein